MKLSLKTKLASKQLASQQTKALHFPWMVVFDYNSECPEQRNLGNYWDMEWITLMGCGTCDPDNFSGRLKLPSHWLKIAFLAFWGLRMLLLYLLLFIPCVFRELRSLKIWFHNAWIMHYAKINFKAEKELTQYSLKWDQLRYEKHRGLFGQILQEYYNIHIKIIIVRACWETPYSSNCHRSSAILKLNPYWINHLYSVKLYQK